MKEIKKLYKMKPGERIKFDIVWDVWRIPGGWLFAIGGDGMICTFIPYNNEFQNA